MTKATIASETLSDRSTVYNVIQTIPSGTTLIFACVSNAHAVQLCAALDDCVDITDGQE